MAAEKLIVKNFGPIREADLDLKKVTVFIGEQASGKSVLAKLIAIFNENMLTKKEDLEKKLYIYNITHLNKQSNIEYKKTSYSIKINNLDIKTEANHSNIFENTPKIKVQVLSNKTQKQIEKERNEMELHLKSSIYIPAERILISLISESLFSFVSSDISLPKFLLNFGSEYEKARNEIKSFQSDTLNIKYAFKNNRDNIIYKEVKSALSDSSSGLQSILPLLLVLEKYSLKKENEHFLFITEEPESNLYPTTQKKLVEYLIEKCTQGDNRLIITTHSPYILTALNNLIQAKNVVKKNPDMADEVNAIVPPQYQIDFDDVAAYFVADGTARSIMNADNQLIDANALDEVSNDINEEFSKLVQLEYQNEVL